jgi:hypothetical protein
LHLNECMRQRKSKITWIHKLPARPVCPPTSKLNNPRSKLSMQGPGSVHFETNRYGFCFTVLFCWDCDTSFFCFWGFGVPICCIRCAYTAHAAHMGYMPTHTFNATHSCHGVRGIYAHMRHMQHMRRGATHMPWQALNVLLASCRICGGIPHMPLTKFQTLKMMRFVRYRFSNSHSCRNKVSARDPWGKSWRFFLLARVQAHCSYTSGVWEPAAPTSSLFLTRSSSAVECLRANPMSLPIKGIFVYPLTLFCTSNFYI